ncbi:MAG: hypothetical protein ACI9KS_002217 [Sulfitobacter sp.]|jgi:hypothetical protein
MTSPLVLQNPVRVPNAPEGARGRRLGGPFWALIASLTMLTIGLTGYGIQRGDFDAQRRVIPLAEIAAIVDDAASRAQTATVSQVDNHLDLLFGPVDAAIPAYADFHYSVLGEYTQLAQLATGQVGDALEERLFGGFQERLDGSVSSLEAQFNATYEQALNAKLSTALEGAELRFLTEGTRIALEDASARASTGKPISLVLGVAGARIGMQAVKIVSRAVARKLVLSIGRKTAAKTATRGTGAGGAAGVGAAIGAPLGPIGAAVGGAGGFIVGWLATDYAVIKLDELFNREEFEAEIRAMIGAERAALRTILIAQIESKRSDITLAGRTPAQIVASQ